MIEHDNSATAADNAGEGVDSNDGAFETVGAEGFSLSDLLNQVREEQQVPPLDPAEARGILRGAFERLTTEHTFKPGDFIQRKPGLFAGTNDLRGGVAMFVRYEMPEPMAYEPMSNGAPAPMVDEDCVLAIVISTGEVAEHYATARYYEPASTVTAVA